MPPLSTDEMPDQPERKRSRRACPEPSRRGGRRPGAGAPMGNLNALKHGANSQQIQQLAVALSLVPEARKALARLIQRQRRQQGRAHAVAVTILTNLLRASLQNLDNQPKDASVTIVPDTPRRSRRRKTRDIDQPALSNQPDQST